jgi:hypothetical protein
MNSPHMPEVGTAPTPPTTDSRANGARTVARRRALPGGRAVVGGILVAGSAVGLFAAYDEARGTPAAKDAWERIVEGAVAIGDLDVWLASSELASVTADALRQSVNAQGFSAFPADALAR